MKPILDNLISKLRDFIHHPRRQQTLMVDLGNWMQLCSCLDTIQDSERAIAAYFGSEVSKRKDLLYLGTYGLLQAMIVQQDAVRLLCKRLGVGFTPDAILRE